MAPPNAGPIRPNAPPVAYKVVSQTPTVGTGPDGRPAEGYRVDFETDSGARGWVFVTRALYSEANVRAAIAPHARELDAVQAIGREG